jgi:hypothetical protein
MSINTDMNEIRSRFVKLVAMHMDIRDQEHEGIYPPYDYERWLVRYTGRDIDDLPPNMIQFNTFKPMVDIFVLQLIDAMDDDMWAEATKPLFKDAP